MFNKSPSDNFFLLLTFMVVLLMGAPTVWSVTMDEEVTESLFATVGDEPAVASRTPASLPQGDAIKPTQLTAFDLLCQKNDALKLSVNGHFVQLQGKNCIKNFDTEKIEIVNQSNGYTASVFISGVNQYQTDLIQLRAGDNEITIRYRETSGKTVEETLRIQSTQI